MPSSCAMSITRDLSKIRMGLRSKVKDNLQGSPVDMEFDMRGWLEMMMASLRSIGWRGCAEALHDDKVTFAWIHWEAQLSTWAWNIELTTVSIIDDAWCWCPSMPMAIGVSVHWRL